MRIKQSSDKVTAEDGQFLQCKTKNHTVDHLFTLPSYFKARKMFEMFFFLHLDSQELLYTAGGSDSRETEA